ncbi:putative thiazole-containing bacteriocin maturation protein [Alicyclobacillus fastidiosus]|uniref:Thiazole-containing bacteriocin maturation protein n=1 Tax=Alicyclobacillus fastidiosus TaxID=392011 RepID=A0ABY6ZGW0_9BACL|nr:putative thiazole-containing bacteriocin maturation protein [Alicyclobacillus fastidiosus]WAH42061.1 putative thiazole-containing bacteriocin maturation protein [Alicyclobacillus fastidiosus]GMA63823.1 putative thiazole-containing bacteriocin maturation protein [Alicyclobacillus fastidiosus]
MGSIQPWMRLKVKGDTFFLPDVDGKVYFRNNVGSFRLEGTSVQAWIEKLLPVFDGQHTLASLTDGLPTPYRDRIFEVAGILYDNGFVRDVSSDTQHQLSEEIVEHYAPQVEFIDNAVGSGAFRFQTYRNSNVLAIGTETFLISLAGALLESGLSTVNMIVTDPCDVHSSRLEDVLSLYRDLDDDVAVHDLTDQVTDLESLQNTVQTMDAVLYVSQSGDIDELRRVESICRRAQKLFIAATFVNGLGLVVPNARPGGGPGVASAFEAVWRRIHRTAFERDLHVSGCTGTSGAILVNVLVFELFKTIVGVDREPGNRLYTLDVETLEGKWHEVIPASDVGGIEADLRIANLHERIASEASCSMSEVLAYFARITDKTSGIFHVWDEGGLSQLPLAQCLVQPINPASNGPAELLLQTVCTGFTHEEARCEAGLTGLEEYVRRRIGEIMNDGQPVGVGAGGTVAEAVGRGLQNFLTIELTQALQTNPATIRLIELGEISDEKCQFYLQALRAMGIDPVVGISDDAFGFPVAWVGTNGRFVGSVGFCMSMALQRTLAYALRCESADEEDDTAQDVRCVSTAVVQIEHDEAVSPIDIEAWPGFHLEQVTAALDALARKGKDVVVLDLALEPFMTDVLAGVMGVCIRQGESQ